MSEITEIIPPESTSTLDPDGETFTVTTDVEDSTTTDPTDPDNIIFEIEE